MECQINLSKTPADSRRGMAVNLASQMKHNSSEPLTPTPIVQNHQIFPFWHYFYSNL